MTSIYARVGGFSDVIERTLQADKDLNRNSLAARLGLQESTLRGWHTLGREPNFDTIVELARRIPERMLRETVGMLLQGTNLKLVEVGEAEPVTCLGHSAMDLARGSLDVVDIVNKSGTRDFRRLLDQLEVVIGDANRLASAARKSLGTS